MAVYAGTVGSLVALECESRLSQAAARSMSTMTTLGGRVIAQLGQAQRRRWQVTVDNSDQTEVGKLAMMLDALPQPWVWLDSWAQVTNLLTPDQSSWRAYSYPSATVGSLVDLEGGGVAVSLNDPTSPTRGFAFDVPAVPGVPFTASVHARPKTTGGSVTVRVSWQDAAGAIITSNSGSRVCAPSGPWTRVTVTATPPAGAVKCYLVATNHIALAAPAVTFTDQAMAWGHGAGCTAAVLPGLSLDVLTAWQQPGGQRASYSFDVIEVG